MKNHFYLLSCFVLLSTFQLFGQTQSIAYPAVGKGAATTFVTDYHCLGINTSALGWGTGYENKRFTMGSSEFGFGMYSDSLNSAKLKNLYGDVKDQFLKKEVSAADLEDKKQAIADYAQAGVSMFFDFNWAGFSFQGKRFGGIAFNIRENYQFYSKFNDRTTDLIFNGNVSGLFDSLSVAFNGDTTMIANRPDISSDTLSNVVLGKMAIPLNLSQLTLGSEVRMAWNRSYNFGYGRKIIGIDSSLVLYGGIGGRYIQSMAMFNLKSDENGLMMYSSVTPSFNIDYGSVSAINPSNFASAKGLLPKSVGDGYGVDLSASVIFFSKLKVAASVNNIGQVTYDRNVYHVKDTLFADLSINGLQNYDITQSLGQLMSDGGLLQLEGQEKYVLKNASDFRFGASFQPFKVLHIGFDMVAPFNKENPGSIQNPVYSFGGEIRPFKWLALSAGYLGGGIYQTNVPIGINFILREGAYEIGISSRDALAFFTQDTHSISTAFGFARFRF